MTEKEEQDLRQEDYDRKKMWRGEIPQRGRLESAVRDLFYSVEKLAEMVGYKTEWGKGSDEA